MCHSTFGSVDLPTHCPICDRVAIYGIAPVGVRSVSSVGMCSISSVAVCGVDSISVRIGSVADSIFHYTYRRAGGSAHWAFTVRRSAGVKYV